MELPWLGEELVREQPHVKSYDVHLFNTLTDDARTFNHFCRDVPHIGGNKPFLNAVRNLFWTQGEKLEAHLLFYYLGEYGDVWIPYALQYQGLWRCHCSWSHTDTVNLSSDKTEMVFTTVPDEIDLSHIVAV